MANFYTHLSVSSVIGIVGGVVLCGAGLISSEESLYLLSFCIFGGLLPDIDSDSDASINIIANKYIDSPTKRPLTTAPTINAIKN